MNLHDKFQNIFEVQNPGWNPYNSKSWKIILWKVHYQLRHVTNFIMLTPFLFVTPYITYLLDRSWGTVKANLCSMANIKALDKCAECVQKWRKCNLLFWYLSC